MRADAGSGIGEHVVERGPRRQRAQLDAQVAAVLGVVDGTVPAPDRAVVQAQLVRAAAARRRAPAPARLSPSAHSGSSGACSATLSRNSSCAPSRTQPLPKSTRGGSRHSPSGPSGRSSPACLNSATRVSCHSRWPRKVGELAAAASTGALSKQRRVEQLARTRRARCSGAPGTRCSRLHGRPRRRRELQPIVAVDRDLERRRRAPRSCPRASAR